MVYNFFDKKSAGLNKSAATHTGTGINSSLDSENQELAKELHKPITRNLKNVSYIHPLRTAYTADMQIFI